MRLLYLLFSLTLVVQEVQAQPVKAIPGQLACESLCAELFASIRADPDKMVMRIEEALVINESCAAEIVTAAIDAVNAEPAMVRKIVETAMDLSPAKASVIALAVKRYTAPTVVAAVNEEIRRPELPDFVTPKPLPGEEVRRAELPLMNRSLPIVEVRRATVAPESWPAVPKNLKHVPKAKKLRE